ncbi:MAG: DNA/RNA non-specific endonuclease [Clostridia bacterium]|nr:DNA/RNA non-specific endonuclease [Clostridia bacterium]
MKKTTAFLLALLLVVFSVPDAFGSALVCCDCDCDGAVEASDARSALRLAIGLDTLTPELLAAADADFSGDITADDARTILRISIGLDEAPAPSPVFSMDCVPAYTEFAYAVINLNRPFFDASDFPDGSFESYGELDGLGRCTEACARISESLMPDSARGDISSVEPTGFSDASYDFIPGRLLFNRCHLIAYSLTGENANPNNLITGTRYMNNLGMLPFETAVAEHIRSNGGSVLYRVTPVFAGSELVCRGVLIEALDESEESDFSFCVFCYNVQPGVMIDYTTGDSSLSDEETADSGPEADYILNPSSGVFHEPYCRLAPAVGAENRIEYCGNRERLIEAGYRPCSVCKP